MKFGEHLASRLTPEWRKQYIQYEQLKTMLYDVFNDLTLSKEVSEKVRRNRIASNEEAFFKLCKSELSKVILFFKQKLAEAHKKWLDLSHEIEELQKVTTVKSKPSTTTKKKKHDLDEDSGVVQPKTLQQLKSTFAEYYLSLVLLQNYQQLNHTGFRKIMKKHDKLLKTKRGSKWYAKHVELSDLATNEEVDKLITDTEKIVTDNLEGGDRKAAMKRLRVPPLYETQSAWTTFRVGLFLGCFLALSSLIPFSVLLPAEQRDPRNEKPRWVGVRLFRGLFLLYANVFLMAINMHGWQSNGINHVLIFEIDPRRHLTYQSLMEISSFFLMVWALCVLGFLRSGSLLVPPAVFPLILILLSVMWLFNPFPILYRSARYWFLRHVYYCFTAPFRKVTFPDFWLADQMISLVTFFLDMEYTICFYVNFVDYKHNMHILVRFENTTEGIDMLTGADSCMSNQYGIRPIVSCLPSLIRVLQCLRRYWDTKKKHPHLTNAGKYCTSFFVVIFGSLNSYLSRNHQNNVLFVLWLIAYVVSYLYTYTWDIKMDWGLLDRSTTKPKHRGLRDDLFYGHRMYYYVAIVEDGILRLAWVMNVSLGDQSVWLNEIDLLLLVTGMLECLRRFIWNFFRLENEHINNCGQFRATRDIDITQIVPRSSPDKK